MGRTERAFYHALAALLFAAACAWSLAALYRHMDAPEPPAPTPAPTAAPAALRFRGLLIRQEQRLPAGAFPDAAPGARLSAADTGTESALYYPACDGWEGLKPEDAERLTPAGLEKLLDAESPGDRGRRASGLRLFPDLRRPHGGGHVPAPRPLPPDHRRRGGRDRGRHPLRHRRRPGPAHAGHKAHGLSGKAL